MSKKPYIPGPWRVCEEKHDDGTLVIRGSGDLEVPPDIVVALIVGGSPDEYDAGTAALIAAAPELLEALQKLDRVVAQMRQSTAEDSPMRHIYNDALCDSSQAISRATG